MTTPINSVSDELTRPIVGIENRSAAEVFDIMCDRIKHQARRAANTTAGALSAAQFEHEVTQQTQAYEFKEGPNGEWLFRCDEWFNLSAVLDALSALPAGEGEDVTSEQALNVAGRIQSIMSEKLSVDEGEIVGVGPCSYKIARLFKPAPQSTPPASEGVTVTSPPAPVGMVLTERERSLLRMVLPSIEQRSREPGDAWHKAADVLARLLSAAPLASRNAPSTGEME